MKIQNLRILFRESPGYVAVRNYDRELVAVEDAMDAGDNGYYSLMVFTGDGVTDNVIPMPIILRNRWWIRWINSEAVALCDKFYRR